MKKSELRQLIKEELEAINNTPETLQADKAFLRGALQEFNQLAERLFVSKQVNEACKKMKRIKEAASNVILTEMDSEYDRSILNKNIKLMESTIIDLEKHSNDLMKVEAKIEDSFDTFGKLLEKYFNIN